MRCGEYAKVVSFFDVRKSGRTEVDFSHARPRRRATSAEDPFRTARLERNRDRDSTATALKKKGLITAVE